MNSIGKRETIDRPDKLVRYKYVKSIVEWLTEIHLCSTASYDFFGNLENAKKKKWHLHETVSLPIMPPCAIASVTVTFA